MSHNNKNARSDRLGMDNKNRNARSDRLKMGDNGKGYPLSPCGEALMYPCNSHCLCRAHAKQLSTVTYRYSYNSPAFAVLNKTSFQFPSLRRAKKNSFQLAGLRRAQKQTRRHSPCSTISFQLASLLCARKKPQEIFCQCTYSCRAHQQQHFVELFTPDFPLAPRDALPLELLSSRLAKTTILCHELIFS